MQDATLLDRLLDPKGKPTGDPLTDMIAEDQRRRSIATLGSSTNPDAAAKANQISRETGVPATTVESNLKLFEGDKNAKLWANMIQQNPKLGGWVEQPRNAAVASDDHDAIGKVASTYDPEAWARKYGTLSSAKAPAPTLWNSVKGVVGSLFTWWDRTDTSQQQIGADWMPSFLVPGPRPGIPNINAPSAGAARRDQRLRTIRQAQDRENALTPGFTSSWGSGVYSGFVSASQIIPAVGLGILTRNPAPTLAAAGLQTGIPAYGKYRARGASANMALLGGVGEGGVEVATELLPMGFLVNKFGKIGAGRFIAEYLGRELPGELAATMAQDAIDTAIANPDKTWGQYWQERPNALLQTAIATLTMSTLTAGASGATNRLARGQGEAISAQAGSEFLDELAAKAAESKTRSRDPEAFASLLKTLGGDDVANVYVHGATVREYLQSDEGADQNFWGPYQSQIAEAVATGGDVVIPTEQAIAHLAGTKAWDALREDMRVTAGGMSLREAGQFEKDFQGSIEKTAGDATSQIVADQAASEPRRALYEAYTQKLMNAGFTPDVARQYAEISSARAVTRAARIGRELTGDEAQSLVVQNQDLADVSGEELSFEQDDAATTAWGKAVDRIARGERGGATVRVGRTPAVLRALGLEPADIVMASGKVARIRREHPEVTLETLRNLPGLVSNPRAAFPSGKNDGSVILAVDARDVDDNPVIVPILAKQEGGHVVLSVYGKQQGDAWIKRQIAAAIREGQQVYIREGLADTLTGPEAAPGSSASSAPIAAEVSAKLGRKILSPRDVVKKTLDQSFMSKVRGRVIFTEGKTVVQLFESANLSTFLHESGHIWLEELKADAESAEAPAQVKADWKTIKAWFKANGYAVGKDGSIPTDAHELWARGVERFAMEGKAPSSALRKAFEAFRSWLLTIYQVVDNLRSPISPEVRDVMGRMLATDEEIIAAAEEQNVRALFTDAAAAGMTEAEFAAYQSTADEARDAAHDALLYRTMVTVRAARTKEFKEQRESVRRDVAENVNNRREFRVLTILRDRENGARLDKQWLIDTYGADALDLIPANVPPLYGENGSPADAIAEQAGFQTADEMVRMLMGIEARRKDMRLNGDKRSVRDSVIDEETDAIMADRYGDPLADGSIEREARELIHNDKQGEVIASELRALSRRRPNLQPTPYQLAKRWAARKVAEGTVSEYTSRSAIQRFQRAARNAGNQAEQAMLKGDIDETFRQKQAQMLNNALVAEATRAADEVDSAVTRLGKVAKRRTMASVDQDYLEQAQALLEQVELRQRSQVSIDKQGKFVEWAQAREAEGHDVIVPPSFAESLGTTHYTRLSVEQLLGLDDAVKQIMHLGRLKQTLIDGKEARDFDAVVKEAQDAAGKLPPKPPSDLMEPGFADRIKSGVASIDAGLLKLETVFDWLDGGDSNGVFNRIAFRPIAEAQDRENAMLVDYYARIKEAMKAVPRDTVRRWSEKVIVPELINRETGNPFVMTRQQLVSMALNMGNEGNIQRLTDGYGWNEAAVRDVLNRELSADEWRFVQQVWDTFETLWPDIARMERAINGVEPEKVAAIPVETQHGTFRGGYYPAIYDTAKDLAAEKSAGKEGDKFGSLYTRATTRASATKDRSAKVSRPILLQLGVINRHLGEVIHDITHREAVMQADKFLSSERVMRAVDRSLGPEIRKQFQPWLKFVANSWAMERSGNEGIGKFINKARANTTAVGMGWRISTIMTQIAGYSNSFEYVGARWVGASIAQTAANPIKAFNFVMERSAEVRTRMDTLDRDIRLTINQMAGKHTPLSDAKRFMFHGIGYADRMVVVPTWLGAYNKALAGGAAEVDAIYQADKAVRKSQGAGSPKDLAAIQRGTGKWGELLRVSTMFYSYMSAYYQRQRTLGRDVGTAVRERDIRATPKLLARAWWLIVVPPLLSELLAGRGPDEDEDWGYWGFKKLMLNMLGPIPLLRDGVQPAWDSLDGKGAFSYSVTPMQRAGETIFKKVPENIHDLVVGDDPKRPVQNAMEAAGYVTGLVPGQLATSTQFLVDVGQGEQDPESIQEWYRGLTKGKAVAAD